MEDFYARARQGHIPALDGLRAIAALMVVGLHGAFNWIPGRVGVLIFFVLSGFLITKLLLDEFGRSGGISLRDFYKRRALRIFPAFYVCWVVTLLVDWPRPNWIWQISSFFYVSNYATAYLGIDMYGSWSLGVEEQFYLIWPLVVVLNARNLARLLRITMGTILLVWAWKIVALSVFDVPDRYLHCVFETRIADILAGCAMAILVHRRYWFPSVVFRPVAILGALAIVGIAGALDVLDQQRFAVAAMYTPAAIATAVLIVQLIYKTQSGPWSLLETAPIKYLGRISYSIYLYHGFAIIVADRLHFRHYSIRVACVFAVTIVFASASYRLVERPFLRLSHQQKRVERSASALAS